MNDKTKNTITCPTCGQTNTWTENNTFKPFCSERCKLIDLGEWASEERRITGDATNNDDSSEDNLH